MKKLSQSLLFCFIGIVSCGRDKNINPLLPSPCDRSSSMVVPLAIFEIFDDFEDGDDTHFFGNEKWKRVDDNGNQGDSFITNVFDSGYMRVDYRLGTKIEKPFAEVSAKIASPDFQPPFRNFTRKPFKKIEFWMKGSGNEVRVGLGNSAIIPTFNFYWHEIFKTCADWTFYSVSLSSNAPDNVTGDGFAQETRATNNSFNLLIQDVDILIFNASSGRAEEGWFVLDDIRLTY